MALIECPDCGKAVSHNAPACPKCGGRIAGRVKNIKKAIREYKEKDEASFTRDFLFGLKLFIFVFIIVPLAFGAFCRFCL